MYVATNTIQLFIGTEAKKGFHNQIKRCNLGESEIIFVNE